MFNSAILDVAIGLIVIFILFSLIASTITEMVAQFLTLRGKNLVKGILKLLGDGWGKKLLDHSLIEGLNHSFSLKHIWKPSSKTQPDYISSETFTTVLTDLLGRAEELELYENGDAEAAENNPSQSENLEAGLKKIQDPKIRESLLALFRATKGNVDAFEKRLATWYDEAMARVSALYKRQAHGITLGIAVLLVIIFNVDTINFSQVLYENSNLREAVASIGDELVVDVDPSEGSPGEQVEARELYQQVMDAKLPLGWPDGFFEKPKNAEDGFKWWKKIMGLLISIFAISLGGPFWFQILNKLVNLKTGGTPPLTLEEKEKQNKTPAPASGN